MASVVCVVANARNGVSVYREPELNREPFLPEGNDLAGGLSESPLGLPESVGKLGVENEIELRVGDSFWDAVETKEKCRW